MWKWWSDFNSCKLKNTQSLFSLLDRRWTINEGKTERNLGESFAGMRQMIYYAWTELEFFASGQSNMPEPKPKHLLLAGGLENKVVMGWFVGTARTPCCCSSEFHCGHSNILPPPPFFFNLRHNKQAVCNGRKMTRRGLWENLQPDSIICACKW